MSKRITLFVAAKKMAEVALLALGALSIILMTSATQACNQVALSNWKSCAIGELSENGGESDWSAVPSWTRSPAIRKYFFGEPRLLANHGMCNEKYHRVTLCLPGWEESNEKDACWYLICKGTES